MCHKLQKATRAGEPVTGGFALLVEAPPQSPQDTSYPGNDGFTIGFAILRSAFGRKIIRRIVRRIIKVTDYHRREIALTSMEAVELASNFHKAAGGSFMKTDGELLSIQFAICVDDDDGIRRDRSIVHRLPKKPHPPRRAHEPDRREGYHRPIHRVVSKCTLGIITKGIVFFVHSYSRDPFALT